jgi:hypothetical protein
MPGSLVSRSQLQDYIETFHRVLSDQSEKHLPIEYQTFLLHNAATPGAVRASISRQGAVSIDYLPNYSLNQSVVSVAVDETATRIEEVLFSGAPEEFLRAEPVMRARDEGKTLQPGENWNYWFIGLHFIGGAFRIPHHGPAHLRFQQCLFSLVDPADDKLDWWYGTSLLEVYGDASTATWSTERARLHATEEVLAGLSRVQRAEKERLRLPEYFRIAGQETVLLLGSYTPEGERRLRALAEHIPQPYRAVLIQDIPDLPGKSLTQKVVTVASLSAFVFVDDTEASGHLMEFRVCKENDWITVVLRPEGKGSSWMTAGASVTSRVIKEMAYTTGQIEFAAQPALAWAVQTARKVRKSYENIYPWASPADPEHATRGELIAPWPSAARQLAFPKLIGGTAEKRSR